MIICCFSMIIWDIDILSKLEYLLTLQIILRFAYWRIEDNVWTRVKLLLILLSNAEGTHSPFVRLITCSFQNSCWLFWKLELWHRLLLFRLFLLLQMDRTYLFLEFCVRMGCALWVCMLRKLINRLFAIQKMIPSVIIHLVDFLRRRRMSLLVDETTIVIVDVVVATAVSHFSI